MVGESNRRLWRKGVESQVNYFFHGDLPYADPPLRGVTFMWRRRVLRSALLILQKPRITRWISCKKFMARSHRIELAGATKKVNRLFFHQ